MTIRVRVRATKKIGSVRARQTGGGANTQNTIQYNTIQTTLLRLKWLAKDIGAQLVHTTYVYLSHRLSDGRPCCSAHSWHSGLACIAAIDGFVAHAWERRRTISVTMTSQTLNTIPLCFGYFCVLHAVSLSLARSSLFIISCKHALASIRQAHTELLATPRWFLCISVTGCCADRSPAG